MQPSEKTERNLHRLFEIGVLLKGANAVLEIFSGFALLFFDVGDIVRAFVENELVEDPNDFLASHLQPIANHFTAGAETFAGLYLISHGIVKIVLVVGLLRRYLWAYPASLVVLGLFILYQSVKWLETHSIGLVLLTVFDIGLIVLVWHEYQRMKKFGGFRT